MERKPIPLPIETGILLCSKRRCALCYGLNNDLYEKVGQIAHLDKNPNNNDIDNLVFLCLEHHDKYDGRTSQSKNYKSEEIKSYRESLYVYNQSHNLNEKSEREKQILFNYLKVYHNLFEFLFTTGRESAYMFDFNASILLDDLLDNWFCSKFKCHDTELQQYQNVIYDNLLKINNNILDKYEYVLGGRGFIFKWQKDQAYNARFEDIKIEMEQYIINIKNAWDNLKTFLS